MKSLIVSFGISTIGKNFFYKSASNLWMLQSSHAINRFSKSNFYKLTSLSRRNYPINNRCFSIKTTSTHEKKPQKLKSLPKLSLQTPPMTKKIPQSFEEYKKSSLIPYEEYKKETIEYNDMHHKQKSFYDESSIQEGYQFYCESSYHQYLEICNPSKRCNPSIF